MKIIVFIFTLSVSFWFVPAQSFSGETVDLQVTELLDAVSRDSIKAHIENLAEAGGYQSRVSYTAGNEWAAHYIKNSFARYLGNDAVGFDTFYVTGISAPYDTIPLVNVIATIKGNLDTTRYFVVGGHFDATANRDTALVWETDWMTAKAPGADDNATGVAATLEIARVLADTANHYRPPVTIKFIAFGAEEAHPLYGSGHRGSGKFVFNAYRNKDNIAGAYILDMFGYNDTGNDYFNIVSDERSVELGRTMLKANEFYKVGLASNAEPFPYATYSDHDRFWAYHYKAILLIENAPPWQDNLPWYRLNPFYHYQSDIPDKVNFEQVYKVTKLTLASVIDLADQVTAMESIAVVSMPVSDFALIQNYPNPFNVSTTIEYIVNLAGRFVLDIYNIKGQKISTLVNREIQPGRYIQQWTALSDNGRPLATGIYFAALRLNERLTTKKIMLMK